MIKNLKTYFQKNNIVEYRIIKNSIKRKKIYKNDMNMISIENENKEIYIIIFNDCEKRGYIKTNLISAATINFIDFIRKEKLLSIGNFKICYTSNLPPNKNQKSIVSESAILEYMKSSENINYIEINEFFHEINVYLPEKSYFDNNTFRYLEFIDKGGNRVTSNITDGLKALSEITKSQLFKITEKLDYCKDHIKFIKMDVQPISFILHFLLSAFNGHNIDSDKSFIKIKNIKSRFCHNNISLICLQNKYLNFDSEGNLNSKFYLIKKGIIENILCDLELSNSQLIDYTATQYNYFSDMIYISSASLLLEMDFPFNDLDYDFEVKYINPIDTVFDLETGVIKCKLIGYRKGYKKVEVLNYNNSILNFLNNVKYVSSEYLHEEDYIYKKYIFQL